jgi:DNA replication regulator DPB11
VDRRRQIVHHISHNGGVYSKDLDRKCTHLVSAKSTGDSQSSEKVKWAVKEISERDTKRRSGKRVDGEDIRIVYEEWIWDCVGFEGRWMANAYDARKQRPVGRVSAGQSHQGGRRTRC